MATQHLCDNHPDTPGDWASGSVDRCPHHDRLTSVGRVRGSGKQRRIDDAKAGQIGIDRGGYIHGTE